MTEEDHNIGKKSWKLELQFPGFQIGQGQNWLAILHTRTTSGETRAIIET